MKAKTNLPVSQRITILPHHHPFDPHYEDYVEDFDYIPSPEKLDLIGGFELYYTVLQTGDRGFVFEH